MRSPACPSEDELSAFAVGNVSGTTFSRIAGHVESCGDCEARLEGFDQTSDGLVTGLTLLKNGPSRSVLPPEVLTIAEDAIAATSNGSSTEISIDPGRRYARQLASGACRLGKFELQAELGAGAFGYVF